MPPYPPLHEQERHLFHIVVNGGMIYLCMADEAFGRRIPFSFLEEVQGRFMTTYGDAAKTALAYAYNTEFARVLHQQMEHFSSNPAADAITRVNREIDEVRSVMVSNIDKVLERGEKIELLVDKTDHLQNDAFTFRRRSRQLRREMWWKNAKLSAMAGGALLLLIYIVTAAFCGMNLRHCS
mmetsp:Transcript_19667/g.62553  ORF Transcript_19667/g.62553 Transcript_19667/m.62553 type:complete len:181 (+) Transcript_19667:239-781(+)